jgi:glutathione S-transferase
MKLFYAPGACSLAVHIALRETRLPFELVKVDVATRSTADGNRFDEVSPRGYVPVLELDDGSRHTEAAALLHWVGERDPSLALLGPGGSQRRQEVLEWLVHIATEVHKPFGWLWQRDLASSTRAIVQSKLAQRFAEIDGRIADREGLAGAFSVADAYAFACISWTRILGMPLDRYPNLQRYLGRVAARSSVQAAMRAEGLLS